MKRKLLLIVLCAAAVNTRAMNYGGAGPKLSDGELRALQDHQSALLKVVVRGTPHSVSLSNEVIRKFVPTLAQVVDSNQTVVKSGPKSAADKQQAASITTRPPLILDAELCQVYPPLTPQALLAGLQAIKNVSSIKLGRVHLSPDAFIAAVRVSTAFGGLTDHHTLAALMLSNKKLLNCCYPAERVTPEQNSVMEAFEIHGSIAGALTSRELTESLKKNAQEALQDVADFIRSQDKETTEKSYVFPGLNKKFSSHFATDALVRSSLYALYPAKTTSDVATKRTKSKELYPCGDIQKRAFEARQAAVLAKK